jgi:hypothetical protein
MSTTQETLNPDEVLVRRFTQYLNGPMGKSVLMALDEGESFFLQTSDHTLKVTKSKGRAVVELSSRRF